MNTLYDLAPLIKMSDIWIEEGPRPLWLKQTKGTISLAESKPENFFADILPCEKLPENPDVERVTCFVEWPSGRHALFTPNYWDEEGAPYTGRPTIPGKYDCYSLVKDWMLRERGIDMKTLTNSPDKLVNQFLTDGAFLVNEEIDNWDRVVIPQRGDGVLFSISQRTELTPGMANHCGVYLGEGKFLHHFPNRASCVMDLDSTWKSWVVCFARYNNA